MRPTTILYSKDGTRSSSNSEISSEKVPLTFDGWDEVPSHYKTRNGWKTSFRRVLKDEQSQATVLVTRMKKFDSFDGEQEIDKPCKLYHKNQTTEIKKTTLNTARNDFYEIFIKKSDRKRQIKWTKGDWVKDGDGGRYWDDVLDHWSWRTYSLWLSKSCSDAHLLGKEIYGVFGDKNSCYLLIDLDLHGGSLDLFKKRLTVLLDEFHGQCRCHFQISNKNAGGVHLLLYFGNASPLATRRKWLNLQLEKIDEKYPECEFFVKSGNKRKLKIEIFPSKTNAHRLPLARERTMLLDQPLDLIKHRKRMVQDVVSYMSWLDNPDRQYMDKALVFQYVMDRLDLSCASELIDNINIKNNNSKHIENKTVTTNPPSSSTSQVSQDNSSLKGKTRGAIINYWLNAETEHFVHLNSAILITLMALRAEGVNKDDAVGIVTEYVNSLPDKSVSSRLLSGNMEAVIQDIDRMAGKLWAEAVNHIWQAVNNRWTTVGFRVSDKSTWSLGNKALEVIVDCENIKFTKDERNLLINKIAPILIGKKQAAKVDRQQVVINAVAYFLRYVHCCDRETPRNALPSILADFDIKIAKCDKQSKFLKLLIELKWIGIRTDYYCPAKHGGKKKGKGKARTYCIGPAMQGKFGTESLNIRQREVYDLYTVFPFLENTEIDGNLALDDQIDEVCSSWAQPRLDDFM